MTRSSWLCAVRRFRGLYGPEPIFANDNDDRRNTNETARGGASSPRPSCAGLRRIALHPEPQRRGRLFPDAVDRTEDFEGWVSAALGAFCWFLSVCVFSTLLYACGG